MPSAHAAEASRWLPSRPRQSLQHKRCTVWPEGQRPPQSCHLMWGEALKVKVVQDSTLEAEWGTVVQFVLQYLLPLSS